MNVKSVKKHICEELAHGKPVQRILNPEIIAGEPKPDLPDWNLVVQWLKDDEGFRADYEHAMKFGAAYLADEMLVLKDQLLLDPKSAPAYKAAMDMIKWATMIRDPKYSERTIQEIKNTTPQDLTVVAARVKQLREELGMESGIIDVEMTEVKPKGPSPKQLAHYEKMREIKRQNDLRKRGERPDGDG